MYEGFFGMKNIPFMANIPSDALYMSSMLDETLGRLEFVAQKQLFAVVTADVGCGKTTALRRFVSELDKDRYVVLYLSDSKLTPRWFYKGLLDQLGVESKFYRGDAKRQLHQQLEIIRGVCSVMPRSVSGSILNVRFPSMTDLRLRNIFRHICSMPPACSISLLTKQSMRYISILQVLQGRSTKSVHTA